MEELDLDKVTSISILEVDGVEVPLACGSGGVAGAIIRTAELPNIDITLAKDGTTIETKNTGAGGKVDFNVTEVGTYTVSTNTWSKEVVVEELNTIVKAYAGDLENYTWEQIHQVCQLGVSHLMWKPKDMKTYTDSGSIYNNLKIMITSIRQIDGKDQIKWCLAYRLATKYTMNSPVGYLKSSTDSSWAYTRSNNGGMKYSEMEQRFKLKGEEIYSQAACFLPEDYSGTLTDGIKVNELYYTDQNGKLCKVCRYLASTDSFEETDNLALGSTIAARICTFIKGYFKSVGTIDETTFNGGYYYTYNSSKYVYTRATSYISGTTYYGLYETLQEDGIFIAGLSAIRQYLVKEERKACVGGINKYLSSFSDYANLLAVEEITGINRDSILPSGIAGTSVSFYNLYGEGKKEEGFDYETQVSGYEYWTRSANAGTDEFLYCGRTVVNASGASTSGVRVCFTTN